MIKNILKKLNRKWIIIGIIILVAIVLLSGGFFKKENGGLKTEKVSRGTLIQEVSETGTIEPAEEINLNFKTAGRITVINVKIGDVVEKGAELMSLDKANLTVQLSQAQASLAVAQIQYESLSKNDKNAAQQDLDSAYQDAINTLDDAYLKIYNAYNAVASIQNSYFNASDQEGIKVQDNKAIINNNLGTAKLPLDAAKASLNYADIDTAPSAMENSLKNTSDALKIIREMCDQGIYYTKVSSTDKTAIDNQKSYIITALSNINNSQQTISSDKIALQQAEDEVDYYQTKVKEAEASVNSYQQQIWDATLRAPINGVITKVDKKIGETVQATESPASIISSDPMQVKTDIYEEDIVKIKIGDPVDIKIAAFPNEILKGRVITIELAEKLIEGVVYYEVTIAFDEAKEGIKPGMTADVVIKTAEKENVLVISKEAVLENGKITVLVLKDGKEEEREIQIGLEGNDGKIEIISGLSEGEEIVIK